MHELRLQGCSVSVQPPPQQVWLKTRLLPLVVIALLLAAIGLGCYIGVSYLLAWRTYRQAEQALAADKIDKARELLAEYLKHWPRDLDAQFLAGRAARRLRDFKEAEEHLRACKELGGDQERLRLEWAMLQAQRDSPAPVEGYLLALVQKEHPDAPLILEALIQGNLKTYQLPKAHHCVEMWLQREPDSLQAVFWRGIIWEKLANTRAAAADFEKVVAGDPEHRAARLHLGDLMLSFNSYDRALEQYEWLQTAAPNNLSIRLGRAACYVGKSRLEEAQELLDGLLRDNPDNPLVLSECGKLALKMERPEQAEEWLRRSLNIDPYEPEAVYTYGQVLHQLGRAEEAKQYREKHEAILADLRRLDELGQRAVSEPRDPSLRHEIGVIFMRNGREKEGVEWLKTALEVDPSYRPTHRVLAEFFERHGLNREAALHREQAGGER
jgi:predicted Zn-dependent protease